MTHPAMAEGMSYKKAQEFRESQQVKDFIIKEYNDGVSVYKIHQIATLHFKVPIGYYTVKRAILKYAGVVGFKTKKSI